MEPNYLSLLKTHDWINRRLEPAPGERLFQQVCHECGRGFVEECSTGNQYAVHVSIFKLHRLSDEVTSRWLSEKCPATRLRSDDTDRQTRFLGGLMGGSLGSVFGEMANSPGPQQIENQLQGNVLDQPDHRFITQANAATVGRRIA